MASARGFAWLGRIRAQAQIALFVFLVALLAQYAGLTYALHRNHALMRDIVQQNQIATKAVDELSEDLANLSYKILGVVGGIYAAPNIAHELRKLGVSIMESFEDVRSDLGAFADARIRRTARKRRWLRCRSFSSVRGKLFLRTSTSPTDAERADARAPSRRMAGYPAGAVGFHRVGPPSRAQPRRSRASPS